MAIKTSEMSKLLGFIINVYIVAASTYTQVEWFKPRNTYNYKDFGSVNIIEFKVPESAVESQWEFHGYTSDYECPEKLLIVSLMHGSIPAINPRNEEFPEYFNTNKTDYYNLTVDTSVESVYFSIKNPKAGLWFALVYMIGPLDEQVKQKGLGAEECKYQIGGIHMIEAHLNAIELMTEEPVKLTIQYKKEGSDQIHRFHTTRQTWKYTIEITDCSGTNSTGGDCPLSFNTGDTITYPSKGVDCSKDYTSGKCSQTVISPATDNWIYFSATPNNEGNVTFTILITLDNCGWYSNQATANVEVATRVGNFTLQRNNETIDNVTYQSGNQSLTLSSNNLTLSKRGASFAIDNFPNITISNSSDICSTVPEMGRYAFTLLTVSYGLRYGPIPFPNRIIVREWDSLIVPFELMEKTDSGGTLSVELALKNDFIDETAEQTVIVNICIQQGSIPIDSKGVFCGEDHMIKLNSSGNVSQIMYFPYPKPGMWFIAMRSKCLEEKTDMTAVSCNNSLALVQFAVEIKPGVNGECGKYSSRSSYSIYRSTDSSLVYSVCKCIAGYRGYGCTDAFDSLSDAIQLLSTLLLTLSNLFFIPAIIVCLKRGYYIEAFIYFYNMFFSTFYHACDVNSYATYCLMPYHVMIHCDFLGSIFSFWTTLIAMANLHFKLKSFLLTFGALMISIGVTKDRHDIWTFLWPVLTASFILAVSWGLKMYKRKTCYPPGKKRWLYYILPGLLIAMTGLLCFAVFSSERTYPYVHSTWHTCMALSIVFLLPPKPHKKTGRHHSKDEIDSSSDNQSDNGHERAAQLIPIISI